MPFHKNARKTFYCVASLGLIVSTTAATPPIGGPRSASPGTDPTTVLHVDQPAPETLLGVNTPVALGDEGDDPGTLVLRSRAEEPAVVPPVGTSVTVVYRDATTTYVTPYSGCTQSSSVGTPYVQNGYARASANFSLSAGCSGNASVSAALQWSHLGWNERGHWSFPSLRPGNSVSSTFAARNACGAGAGTWRTVGFFGGSSSGNSTSPSVSLSCRG